jgi:heme exporter protein A
LVVRIIYSAVLAKYHAFATILTRRRLIGGVSYARVREATGFFSLSVAVNPPDRSYAASVPPTEAAFLFGGFLCGRRAVTIAPPMPPPDTFSPTPGFTGRALACQRGERLIFRGLDFTLPAGGALLLLGPNGSGKSSLLRLMAGLTPPAAGALAWDGVALRENPAAHRARLHFIGHSDALKPVLSARETLDFWARMRGASGDVMAALARFGLAAAADLPCRYLSAGQRRRLALARLIAIPAPLWLLDEPLTSLDAEAATQLLEAVAGHRRSGGRIVLSTHVPIDLPDAMRLLLADFRPAPAELAA